MARNIRDIMTPVPVTLPFTSSVLDAARQMKDHNIGDVIVVQDDRRSG